MYLFGCIIEIYINIYKKKDKMNNIIRKVYEIYIIYINHHYLLKQILKTLLLIS